MTAGSWEALLFRVLYCLNVRTPSHGRQSLGTRPSCEAVSFLRLRLYRPSVLQGPEATATGRVHHQKQAASSISLLLFAGYSAECWLQSALCSGGHFLNLWGSFPVS